MEGAYRTWRIFRMWYARVGGFRVQGFGIRVQGLSLGFRIRVQGLSLGFRIFTC